MGEYYNNSGKYQYLYNDPKKLVSNLPESGDFDLILDLLSKYEYLWEDNYESVLESVTVSEVDNPWKIPESILNTSTLAGPYSLVGEDSTVPPNK